jgi:hypothetical protein
MDISGGHIYTSSTEPIGEDNRYYWVSFADRDQFYGVAILHCETGDPVTESWLQRINPGADHDCDVIFQPLSPADISLFKDYLGKLPTDRQAMLKLAKEFH